MRIAAAAFALAFVAAAQQQQERDFSKEKEAALGKAVAEDYRRQARPLEEPALTDYLSRLAARLNAPSPRGFALTIDVTRETEVREATMLPAMNLFVPLGALTAADNEAALAGIVAHGLAHASLGHNRPQPLGSGRIPLLLPQHGPTALVPMGWLPYQRKNETEADRLAAELLSRAGFDPTLYGNYVSQLKGNPGNDPGERLEAIRQAPLPAVPFETGEFAAIRERARALAAALASAPPPPSLREPPRLRRNP